MIHKKLPHKLPVLTALLSGLVISSHAAPATTTEEHCLNYAHSALDNPRQQPMPGMRFTVPFAAGRTDASQENGCGTLRGTGATGGQTRQGVFTHGGRTTCQTLFQLLMSRPNFRAGRNSPPVVGVQTQAHERFRLMPEGQQIWSDARADGHSPDERSRIGAAIHPHHACLFARACGLFHSGAGGWRLADACPVFLHV